MTRSYLSTGSIERAQFFGSTGFQARASPSSPVVLSDTLNNFTHKECRMCRASPSATSSLRTRIRILGRSTPFCEPSRTRLRRTTRSMLSTSLDSAARLETGDQLLRFGRSSSSSSSTRRTLVHLLISLLTVWMKLTTTNENDFLGY